MKWFWLTCCSIAVWGCLQCGGSDPSNQAENFHHYVKPIPAAVTSRFPGPVVPLSPPLAKAVRSSERLIELLPLERLIRLEVSDSSIIAEISEIVRLDNAWFLLDRLQGTILKFADDGRYLKTIGRKGEGPGEYGNPVFIKACFNHQLGVYDGNRGVIHLFDSEGNFVFSTSQYAGPHRVMPNYNFIWESRDRLYLATFPSLNPQAPWHALLDYSAREYRVLGGFGRRFEPLLKIERGRRAFQCFNMIENRLWTGTPYGAWLEVFDRKGRFLGKTEPSPRMNALQYEDFDGLDEKKWARLRSKAANGTLLQVGPLVFARVGKLFDIYDVNGNRLRTGLKRGKFHPPRAAYTSDTGTYAISQIIPSQNTEYYHPGDLAAMKDDGFDPEFLEDLNPYLRVGRLIHE